MKYILFLAAMAIFVFSLWIFNRLPDLLEKGSLREYSSLDDARNALRPLKVVVPSYFPDNVAWPPKRILAQKEPYLVLLLEFSDKEGREAFLMVCEADTRYFPRVGVRRPSRVRESVDYSLKGRNATLEVGEGEGGGQMSAIRWEERGVTVYLALRSAPFELVKIAESMVSSE